MRTHILSGQGVYRRSEADASRLEAAVHFVGLTHSAEMYIRDPWNAQNLLSGRFGKLGTL